MQRGIEYLRGLSLTLVDPVSGQAIRAIPLVDIEREAIRAQGGPSLDVREVVGNGDGTLDVTIRMTEAEYALSVGEPRSENMTDEHE